eukprot:scaffold224648_cov18-Tisochrysis_lutea.AAC.1
MRTPDAQEQLRVRQSCVIEVVQKLYPYVVRDAVWHTLELYFITDIECQSKGKLAYKTALSAGKIETYKLNLGGSPSVYCTSRPIKSNQLSPMSRL